MTAEGTDPAPDACDGGTRYAKIVPIAVRRPGLDNSPRAPENRAP